MMLDIEGLKELLKDMNKEYFHWIKFLVEENQALKERIEKLENKKGME